MERRILKDFQIGLVEGIVNEVLVKSHEPKDVFSQIAKAIGTRASGKNTNWNELVRKNTVKDPIGSTNASIQRVHRRSLRRAIMDSAHKGMDINTEKLLEYNPLLSEVSQTTRVAYVKFMSKKMKKDDHADTVFIQNETDSKLTKTLSFDDGDSKPGTAAFGSLVTKASIKRRESEEEMQVPPTTTDTISVQQPSDARDIKDFRCRTPIVEDPNEEDRVTSPEDKNGEMSPQSPTSPAVLMSPEKESPSPKPSTPIPTISQTPAPAEEEVATTAAPDQNPSDLLQVASRSKSRSATPTDAHRPVTPIMTSSKGKSAVSGRSMEGWI